MLFKEIADEKKFKMMETTTISADIENGTNLTEFAYHKFHTLGAPDYKPHPVHFQII